MELSGRSDFLSLFDVAQVLSVNEASGMLRVEDDAGKAYLYFDGGAIINALDEERREGEEAAKRVFAKRSARFSFVAELPSVARRISCSTQHLMMEIARALDEEAAGAEGDGDHLREAREATSALRELFRRLDSESRGRSPRSPHGAAVAELLAAIRGATGTVLFLRAGARPEVHAGGRVVPLGATPLDRPGYESLRDHLLRAGDGEAYELETYGGGASELLAVRPLLPDADAPLPWDEDELIAALDAPGSLALVRGFADDVPDAAIRAIVRRLAGRDALPLVACAPRWPEDVAGGKAAAVLLRWDRSGDRDAAPDLVDRLAPRFLVVVDADAAGVVALALRALRRGSRAIVGVRSAAAERAAPRLLDALPPADRAGAARTIADSLAVVLELPAGGGPGRVLPAGAAMLEALASR